MCGQVLAQLCLAYFPQKPHPVFQPEVSCQSGNTRCIPAVLTGIPNNIQAVQTSRDLGYRSQQEMQVFPGDDVSDKQQPQRTRR